MSRNDSRGFSLIELLITLVVIGIIAAMTIPNLLAAIDKGKQKRTDGRHAHHRHSRRSVLRRQREVPGSGVGSLLPWRSRSLRTS
jgi:prepilin-type N-terminal cleavage/methylation domain-containing protein